MIVDFHARLSPGPGALDALLGALDSAGVDRAAVCAGGLVDLDRLSVQIVDGGRSEARADNEGVRRACAASGGRLVPFFFADPGRDAAEYAAVASGYRGLEISPAVHGFRLDDPGVDELAAVAARHGHPVYVVCLGRPGTRAEDLAALAGRHPSVTFVSGHCGHTGLDAAGLTRLAGVPNVAVELSGCFTAVARLAVRRLGAGRVLFGTEHPLQHPAVEVAKLRALGLPPGEHALVAGGNALRLLSLEDR
ncbi:amidohydrolase family protein [Dactylosporangium salmoneum]|uniref:Amidohydrolase-related domain-containing protein n=1 Tax=Dactylosporangium salmoneum TaxID=53361 RepID=A0ABP5SRQ0_9ACTN